jgi:hypothetical protein
MQIRVFPDQEGKMNDFFEIKSLKKEEQTKILKDILESIKKKQKEGIVTEKEVREIEEMRLRPIPDIQDVQSVFEGLDLKKK